VSTDAVAQLAGDAGVVGRATLASRVLGFVRDTVVANSFDRALTDAFFVAFMIPNLLRRLVGEGALTTAFVPVFTAWLQRSREEARQVLSATWTLGALIGLVLTAAGMIWADALVHVFAPGFSADPEKHRLSVELLRLCFPYIFFMILLAIAMGALNALGHFVMPAFAPVMLNVLLIAAALTGPLWLDVPIRALGWAAVAAGAVQVWMQLPQLLRRGLAPALRLDARHPAIRRLARLMGPAVLAGSVFQLNLVVSRFLASFGGDGAVSYLYYADRLLELPLGGFVLALGTASLPSFSRLVQARERERLRVAFSSTLGLALALALPSTAGLVLLREEIFSALFRWDPDVFTRAAVEGCARALLFYSLGLVSITLSRIYLNLCAAHENTRTGAHAAVVSLTVNVLASLALIGPLPAGALPDALLALQHRLSVVDLGYAGLALASSIASTANALYVIASARARYGSFLDRRELLSGMRTLLATLAMCGALLVTTRLTPVPEVASVRALVLLALHVACGALVYLTALRLMRAPEAAALLAMSPLRRR
jgi:putative peptidoglycan lipid II flippase